MNEAECQTFDEDHPPLLKECGFGFVEKHHVIKDTQQKENVTIDITYELADLPFSKGPFTLAISKARSFKTLKKAVDMHYSPTMTKCAITRQKQWRQVENPRVVAAEETMAKTITFTQTLSTIERFEAELGVSVRSGFSGFGAEFGAELSASITEAKEHQKSETTSISETDTIKLEAGYTYAFWVLEEIIRIEYEPYNGWVTYWINDVRTGKQLKNQPIPTKEIVLARSDVQDRVKTESMQ